MENILDEASEEFNLRVASVCSLVKRIMRRELSFNLKARKITVYVYFRTSRDILEQAIKKLNYDSNDFVFKRAMFSSNTIIAIRNDEKRTR